MTGEAFALTCDAFLGGQLNLWQPRSGYRAGIDPVLLASAVPAKTGQSVLDLGCGVGTAMFCLAVRVPGLRLTGVERQAPYAALARRNAAEACLECVVEEADVATLPASLRQMRFDHVLANPPYFDPTAHSQAADAGRAGGRSGGTPLATWVDAAARRLAPRGYLHMIQRVSRLPELVAACEGRVGSLEILPFSSRQDRAPQLMILRARKGGRASFVLHAPMLLHGGNRHGADGDGYAPEISDVLRNTAALGWPGDHSDRES